MEFPAGWINCTVSIKDLGDAGLALFGFWDLESVYLDSCHWEDSAASPKDRSSSLFTDLIREQRTSDASDATDVRVGDARGLTLRLEVPPALDVSECDVDENGEAVFQIWRGSLGDTWSVSADMAPGLRADIWLVDVDGTLLAIQAATFAGAPESARDEMRAMVESIDFLP